MEPAPILELRPGAPVPARAARRWTKRAIVAGVLAFLGFFVWLWGRHYAAVAGFASLSGRAHWERYDQGIGPGTRLDLSKAAQNVDDNHLDWLASLSHLRSLDLSGCFRISDFGVAKLARQTELRELHLSKRNQLYSSARDRSREYAIGPAVTDKGMEYLRGLKNLQILSLEAADVTDQGLANLAGLTNLDTLDLSDTLITDEGLHHLYGLKKLRFVNVEGSKVTCPGRDKLLEMLPDTQIMINKCEPGYKAKQINVY